MASSQGSIVVGRPRACDLVGSSLRAAFTGLGDLPDDMARTLLRMNGDARPANSVRTR